MPPLLIDTRIYALLYTNKIFYLIREVFRMRRSKPHSQVGINFCNPRQQLPKSHATLLRLVNTLETFRKFRWLQSCWNFRRWQVSVTVDVLACKIGMKSYWRDRPLMEKKSICCAAHLCELSFQILFAWAN